MSLYQDTVMRARVEMFRAWNRATGEAALTTYEQTIELAPTASAKAKRIRNLTLAKRLAAALPEHCAICKSADIHTHQVEHRS